MRQVILSFVLSTISCSFLLSQDLQTDIFKNDKHELKINFVGHASLFIELDGKITHIDPVFRMGDYLNYPKADLILVTHHHSDHFDLNAIEILKKDETKIVFTQECYEMVENLSNVIIMKNEDVLRINHMTIEAVPAYNIIHRNEHGTPYHPKGQGNGYIIKTDFKTLYIAGDTEKIPEMKTFPKIDIAFLPANLPYTMSLEMVARVARIIRPKIIYPYHYDYTQASTLKELLKNQKNIEVRIKDMK